MSERKPDSIAKNPELTPAQDFYALRKEGIGLIEKMGSVRWTDYNAHDPGITILDSLCYAITDLAYRAGWDIKDLLTPQDQDRTYLDDQAFFTAREILTVNPWTPEDFRRLLIDLAGVRNAWVFCKECACDAWYYAWCEKNELQLGYQEPEKKPEITQIKRVDPVGLYEVLIELESDAENGDLNDRKIEQSFNVVDPENGAPRSFTIEMRFPKWEIEDEARRQIFLNGVINKWELVYFGVSKTHNILEETDSPGKPKEEKQDDHIKENWSKIFYTGFNVEVDLQGTIHNIAIEQAALRIFSNSYIKNNMSFADLKHILENGETEPEIPGIIYSRAGFIERYHSKLNMAQKALKEAKDALFANRNLSEDFCLFNTVDLEDVAVCANIELAPDADIEKVQAEVWFTVETYLNPALKFYSLQEMLDSGKSIEEIFNGPELECGFIQDEDLKNANLKTRLKVSDLIHLIMDIEGVIAVNSTQLVKYDNEGNVVKGAADPEVGENGKLNFHHEKSSASWVLYLKQRHLPRFYLNGSCIVFYKNGLPFKAGFQETRDIFIQLQGESAGPQTNAESLNPPLPEGTHLDASHYHPVQYDFPFTYGVGPDGLAPYASAKRRSQARQLKAYLLVFEQILANAFSQIAHTADLFSLDTELKRTYFIKELSEQIIHDYDNIASSLGLSDLEALTETTPEFLDRRNRFLDHIMARFAEHFKEYALVLSFTEGKQEALQKLIEDKIFFIMNYPVISHDRARAFNYKKPPSSIDNFSGIKRRINLLAGVPAYRIEYEVDDLPGPDNFRVKFIFYKNKSEVFTSDVTVTAFSKEEALYPAEYILKLQMSSVANFKVSPKSGGFEVQLEGSPEEGHGLSAETFETESEAVKLQNDLQYWALMERVIVIEHILLRPKFPGDALYPACSEGSCNTCGNEDPYSFRYTFVIPAVPDTFAENLEMRAYIEQSIRREFPAHLLGKICWVAAGDQSIEECNPVLGQVANLLIDKQLTSVLEEACECADFVYELFHNSFQEWFEANTLKAFEPEELEIKLKTLFDQIEESDISCSFSAKSALPEIKKIMLDFFTKEALKSWKFEKFEEAWRNWLEANSQFDWAKEKLYEKVESILSKGVVKDPKTKNKPPVLDPCVCAILEGYGAAWHEWLKQNFEAGKAPQSFDDFLPPAIEDLICTEYTFTPKTLEAVSTLLIQRFDHYTEVSFYLKTVVTRLAGLRNIYPVATLHDWDEGNDKNPVRLGKSTLGGM